MRSGLSASEVKPRIGDLIASLFRRIPTGVGARRADIKMDHAGLREVLGRGAAWAVERGFGLPADLERAESSGAIPEANADLVSSRALERGRTQLGTLGSGNHFIEVQIVREIFDAGAAAAFGLEVDQITVMIHSGSRGLGHQVCDDSLETMLKASAKYGIDLPDRQLCCAPVRSPEGKAYLGAMAAAANFAFANRQVMLHKVREAFEELFGGGARDLALDLVYDVCHNIAKMETHEVNGKPRKLCVHRKGATRAFPPGHPEIPSAYRETGQPVLIPGDMGRYSFVLAGTEGAFRESWGSTCHGAGRRLSRAAARRSAKGRRIIQELAQQGIVIKADGMDTVLEEIPEAYKDVADVVDVVCGAGIARKVARLTPIGVIKG
jgi:tRNA-splicing ligase RtcB